MFATSDWILIIIMAVLASAAISWVITYTAMNCSKQYRCTHNFENILDTNTKKTSSTAYLCTKCGKVKKVTLHGT